MTPRLPSSVTPSSPPRAKALAPVGWAPRSAADLSADQRAAHDGVLSWFKRGTAIKQTLTLAGYAGTGKSTVVSLLAHELLKIGPLAFATFTGKASSVLARKLRATGIDTISKAVGKDPLTGLARIEPRPYCGTIHGLVYRPCDACTVEEAAHEHTYGPSCRSTEIEGDLQVKAMIAEGKPLVFDVPCPACDPPPPVRRRDGFCPRCRDTRYLRRDRLDRKYRLLVIDEASMVDDDMLQVLLSYGVPLLAVGDHGQLQPVRGVGSLMETPDIRLEQIHRQAANSPIIALSAKIRERGDIDDRLEDGKAFTILSRRDLPEWIESHFPAGRLDLDPRTPEGILGTVVISWTNKLRVGLNYDIRAALERDESPPSRGEVLICLKNKPPVYNGMRGVLVEDVDAAGDARGKAPKWRASVDFVEDGQVAQDILISHHQLLEEKTLDYDRALELGVSMSNLGELYDFGYALTCHKMQGAQAPEVGVVLESGLMKRGKDERTRWLYTSVTRAETRLTVVR